MSRLSLLVLCSTSVVALAADPAPRIPFVEGLTTIRVATSPVGDYETLRVVEHVDASGFRIVTSGEAPSDSGEGLSSVHVSRHVRREDQLHSHNVRIVWHTSDPEMMSGNVPGISCEMFRELQGSGHTQLTYVPLSVAFGGAAEASRLSGTMTVVGRKSVGMLVNRQQVSLPALQVSGTLSGDEGREAFSFDVLDDPDNPMLLGAQFGAARAHVLGIEFVLPPAALESAMAGSEPLELSGVYFAFAQATLRPESAAALAQLASVLKAHADWHFRVDGHTDSIGTDAANLELSRQRSAAVRTALTQRFGVAASQLTTAGFGESRPKDTNETDVGRARNRRVELVRDPPPKASAPVSATGGTQSQAASTGSACRQ